MKLSIGAKAGHTLSVWHDWCGTVRIRSSKNIGVVWRKRNSLLFIALNFGILHIAAFLISAVE
jgi:hypothetical protein